MSAPAVTTGSREGQLPPETQSRRALAGTNSRQATADMAPIALAPAGPDLPQGHACPDTQQDSALGGQDTERGQRPISDHSTVAPLGSDHPQAMSDSTPKTDTPAGSDSPARHSVTGAQGSSAGGGANSDTGHRLNGTHAEVVGVGQTPAGSAIAAAEPIHHPRSLLDPLLTLASVTLDDLEALRIAQENRYRSLTEHGVSENGVEWGYGLDDKDPQVAQAGAMVDSIKALEHQAALHLQRLMRKHPLGPWVKAQRGIGDKQAARLLGVIGDPYWHTAEDRPRTVSELWAYCGLHTLPARHPTRGAQISLAGGGHNVAARRRKGQQANWSDEAKKRAWLIATSCLKAGGPYREVYDQRREATADREHAVECVRCGPSGKPAQPGSPWSLGHQHADALRIASKAILRDLWRESKRLHQEAIE